MNYDFPISATERIMNKGFHTNRLLILTFTICVICKSSTPQKCLKQIKIKKLIASHCIWAISYTSAKSIMHFKQCEFAKYHFLHARRKITFPLTFMFEQLFSERSKTTNDKQNKQLVFILEIGRPYVHRLENWLP